MKLNIKLSALLEWRGGNMSTATLPEVREGYFPRWKLKTSGVIMPEERLPWGQTIVSGLQHGVAMAGGTIIGPLIMGFDPNLASFRASAL
jgi:putative pyrimidine permease RutG